MFHLGLDEINGPCPRAFFAAAGPVPVRPFAVVYLLAVVIASVRLNVAISKSSPADIAKKVESIYRLPWLDLKSKSTFQDYVQQLAMVDRGKP